jgi:hypothetical protein
MKMSINRQDLVDFGQMGIKKWEKGNSELLSCYESKKLRQVMGTFSELESNINPVSDLLNEQGFSNLPENQQFAAVIRAIEHSFNVIFLTLFDRGALDRLLVIDETTDEAEAQIDRMREAIAEYEANQRALQQQAAAIAAAPVEIAIDPVDQCVADFHALGSAQFKAKYLNNQHGREHYNAAIAAGRI